VSHENGKARCAGVAHRASEMSSFDGDDNRENKPNSNGAQENWRSNNNVVDLELARVQRELEAFCASDPLARRMRDDLIVPVIDNDQLQSFKNAVQMRRPRKRPEVFAQVARQTIESRQFKKWARQSEKPAAAFAPQPIPFPPRSDLGAAASDPITQFRDAMLSAGLRPPHILADGKIHRFATNGKKPAGWYIISNGNVPHGAFGDWRQGLRSTWVADLGRKLTREECEELKADEAERNELAAKARKRAAYIWNHASPAPEHFPYLEAKCVSPDGLRTYKGVLVVPVRDVTGDLMTVQFIDRVGEKKFLRDGTVKGGFYAFGTPNDTIYIAEGVASGATIYAATGIATVCALSSGNLEPVAKALRAKYSHETFVICADDDWKRPSNPGLTEARKAARAIGAKLAVPSFGPNRARSSPCHHSGQIEPMVKPISMIFISANASAKSGIAWLTRKT
jgi:putative DNA primase/helicase